MAFDVWLENRTPFAAATHVQLDGEGQEVLLVMVSASFHDAGYSGTLDIAQDQLPVCFADEPLGNPERSSNRHEADIAPEKPSAEVIVIGQAHAPGGTPAPSVDVGLRIGPVQKVLTVTGDRLTDIAGNGPPHPFRTMPLVWERAFGGSLDDGTCDMRNPVGIGWHGAVSADPAIRSQLPNIAYKGDRDPPERAAGFGPVGRGWQPRLALAGTYNQAWIDTQWPLPPKDFDPHHNLSAPEDQRLPELTHGTKVSLVNMTPNGHWTFRCPAISAPLQLIYEDRIEALDLIPDTMIIEPDAARVTLKARHPIRVVRNRPRLKEVVLGHVSPVWLSARRKGKAYLNPKGGDGTLTDKPVWAE